MKDNIGLFTPEILDRINVAVVEAGHRLLGKGADLKLKGRCDSFAVETDVHFPTDANLLLDAIRKTIFLIGGLCFQLGIADWRQYGHLFKKVRKAFNAARKLKRSTSRDETARLKREELIMDAHRKYADLVESLVVRAKQTLTILDCMDVGGIAQLLVVQSGCEHQYPRDLRQRAKPDSSGQPAAQPHGPGRRAVERHQYRSRGANRRRLRERGSRIPFRYGKTSAATAPTRLSPSPRGHPRRVRRGYRQASSGGTN